MCMMPVCVPTLFFGGKFHLQRISSSAGPLGLACFLFGLPFFSSSSEVDDSIAFLGLRRMRRVTSGVAVGGIAVGGVAAGGGSVTVSERNNKKKLETFDEM